MRLSGISGSLRESSSNTNALKALRFWRPAVSPSISMTASAVSRISIPTSMPMVPRRRARWPNSGSASGMPRARSSPAPECLMPRSEASPPRASAPGRWWVVSGATAPGRAVASHATARTRGRGPAQTPRRRTGRTCLFFVSRRVGPPARLSPSGPDSMRRAIPRRDATRARSGRNRTSALRTRPRPLRKECRPHTDATRRHRRHAGIPIVHSRSQPLSSRSAGIVSPIIFAEEQSQPLAGMMFPNPQGARIDSEPSGDLRIVCPFAVEQLKELAVPDPVAASRRAPLPDVPDRSEW